MGTFVNFYGDMTVAPEKLPELTERMARLWEQGGMMQVEDVNLFGKHISLLHQPEPDERADGWIWTCYNYHENDFWETFSYGPASGRLCSSKLGQLNFCRIVLASYILLEFYVEGFALTALDGDMINGEPFIGWLNYIFDEQYTNQRGKRPVGGTDSESRHAGLEGDPVQPLVGGGAAAHGEVYPPNRRCAGLPLDAGWGCEVLPGNASVAGRTEEEAGRPSGPGEGAVPAPKTGGAAGVRAGYDPAERPVCVRLPGYVLRIPRPQHGAPDPGRRSAAGESGSCGD